jgi:choline kinase
VQAIILAAGAGLRLGDPKRRPKCMRKIGGRPLVHHQVEALARAGIDDLTIVVGYEHEQVRQSVGPRARYLTNEDFATTNSMYSFLLARPAVRGDVLVLNSDVFFHPDLLDLLLDAGADALLYDARSGDDDEQMKIRLDGDRLVEMSKSLPEDQVSGENLGMLYLSERTANAAFDAAYTLTEEGELRAWLATAVNAAAQTHDIRCVDVDGAPWVEIDFPEDLDRARLVVYPAVASAIDACDRAPGDSPLLRSVS